MFNWLAVYNDNTPPPTPPEGGDKKGDKLFTQADVNNMLAEHKRTLQKNLEERVKELEDIKKSKSITEEERNNLQTKIEGLNNSLLSSEEKAKREKEKLDKDYKIKVEEITNTSTKWQNLYSEELTRNTILMASRSHGAVSEEQMLEILLPKTKIVEEVDGEGKGTGRYTPKVKFTDTDKNGKPMVLDLTIEEAVKKMKDSPERFGNLFKSDVQPGLGLSGGSKSNDSSAPPKDPLKYREWRKKHGLGRV